MRRFLALLLSLVPLSALAEPTLTAPTEGTAGDTFTVQVSGLDPTVGYWVTLLPQEARIGTWDKYVYIENQAQAEVSISATTATPGAFEFRLHDKIEPYPLYAAAPITLTQKVYGPPSFTILGAVNAQRNTKVTLSGLDPAIRYWVTLIPASEPVGTWAQYHYVEGLTEATVSFDPVPGGAYQLRLHDRAEGYALYLSQDVTVAGAAVQTATPAQDEAPQYTGPCPKMSNTDSASVAACLRHLSQSSVAHVFKTATSTCQNMQFQLTLSQENKEGTRQNLRGVDLARTKTIDCKMIAAQVSQVFGYDPGWANCTDHPSKVGPAEHIACIESTVVLTPGRGARSADLRSSVFSAFPTSCTALRSRLQDAYAGVFPDLKNFNTFAQVFPRDMSCAAYQPYLDTNVVRRDETLRRIGQERARDQQAALEQQQAWQNVMDAMDTSLDQIDRDAVAARTAARQDPGEVTPRDLTWALVKVLHRLEPERKNQVFTLLHTIHGLRQRSGRGPSQIVSTHAVADLRLQGCDATGEGAMTCKAEVTMQSAIHAPNDQAGAFILGLLGPSVRRVSTLSVDLTHNGTQWALTRVTPDILDVLMHVPEGTQSGGGFRSEPYSPEDCLWLRSMGASGIC